MSQSLIINGKEYVQSSVLTSLYKYTPDYIGKLAREEKIIGTQVGRQWYIEPESLKIFLHKTAIEKEIRAEELSLKRKVEHQAFQQKQNIATRTASSPYVALAQVLAVIGCGAIAGLLGWNVSTSNLTLGDVGFSLKESTSLIAQTFSPVDALQDLQTTSGSFFTPASLDTQLEVSKDSLEQQFSDEVIVTEDTEGSLFVQPVFKQEGTSTQIFEVVPVVPVE